MKRIYLLLCSFFIMTLLSCGTSTRLDRMVEDLSKYPQFSVILEDMKEEGNFVKEFFHKYKLIYAKKASEGSDPEIFEHMTDWEKVSKKEFRQHANNLGMTLVSKGGDDDKISKVAQPAGYQYVGNPQYGQWQTNSSGGSFWEFYGKYAMLSQVIGMFSGPVFRRDYDDYRSNRSSNRPYYGRNNQYGTNGTYTQKSNPTFFQRKKAQLQKKRSTFSEKVKKRAQRSRSSSLRRRSSGVGK